MTAAAKLPVKVQLKKSCFVRKYYPMRIREYETISCIFEWKSFYSTAMEKVFIFPQNTEKLTGQFWEKDTTTLT